MASISSRSTAGAVKLAEEAEAIGCSGLMVLHPYVYTSDWREMQQHVSAVIAANLYHALQQSHRLQDRLAPEQIAELAGSHENLAAVKEWSADVSRVTAIRKVLADGPKIFIGVDDVLAGAKGWIAGLVNACPAESVELFHLASAGKAIPNLGYCLSLVINEPSKM